jgi:hypothetical protein
MRRGVMLENVFEIFDKFIPDVVDVEKDMGTMAGLAQLLQGQSTELWS